MNFSVKINTLIIGILLLGCAKAHSQQDSQFTQYMYNTININPAYAGSRGAMSIFGMHREQWVGLDGAPKTNAFSINTPIKNSKLGLGVSFINDEMSGGYAIDDVLRRFSSPGQLAPEDCVAILRRLIDEGKVPSPLQ